MLGNRLFRIEGIMFPIFAADPMSWQEVTLEFFKMLFAFAGTALTAWIVLQQMRLKADMTGVKHQVEEVAVHAKSATEAATQARAELSSQLETTAAAVTTDVKKAILESTRG